MFLFAFIHMTVFATTVGSFPNGIKRNAVFRNFQGLFKNICLLKGSFRRNIPSHAGYQSLLKMSTYYPPPSNSYTFATHSTFVRSDAASAKN